MNDRIIIEDVSKFYGEVLGVNRVNLSIPPGITSLVGPNGSGKTTLMNLMTGLIHPTRGNVLVLGLNANNPEELFRITGYCTQFDSFPRGLSGYQFVSSYLRLLGCSRSSADEMAWRAIARVKMTDAADRKISGYSKGMRQRIKLAQALCHNPRVLILDEPLNGLDPLVRAETIALFRTLAAEGRYVIISSHILQEIDAISDRVVLLNGGYIVAEGQIHAIRNEIEDHPIQILIRSDRPRDLAATIFREENTTEARILEDGHGLLIKTRDAEKFYLLLNRIAQDDDIEIESVVPADDNVNSLYQYLIGREGVTE